jgi:predicted O-linked N-acetylglucosamine transferase (SPINDLY family)
MLFTDLTVADVHDESGNEGIADCWQIGLEHILADDFEAAQASLLLPFLNIDSEAEEEFLQSSLIEYLQGAARQQEDNGSLENSYKILSFVQDLFPNDINNLLHSIDLAMHIEIFEFDMLIERHFLSLLADAEADSIDHNRLYGVVQRSLRLFNAELGASLSASFFPDLIKLFLEKTFNRNRAVEMVLEESFLLGQQRFLKNLRILLLEVCLEMCSEEKRFQVICQLSTATAYAGQFTKSMQLAEQLYEEYQGSSCLYRMMASHNLLHCLMEAGEWQRIPVVAELHQENIWQLVTHNDSDPEELGMMISSEFFLNYIYDQPRPQHQLRNSIGKIVAPLAIENVRKLLPSQPAIAVNPEKKILNIGYVASTLTKHSVGWLSRWLFAHHSCEDFKIFIYNVNQSDQDSFNHKYFRDRADWSHYFGIGAAAVVKQIQADEIDILVDMDSSTLSTTYEVMCCKPAPIQVTWLGWDASGCPGIDYFIADPYVLPLEAEEYYQAKIWRLPQTYVAVDGFEVDTPTKRREDYGIPADAIVYLCGQKSYKHNPDILRLQMQIIREVPNSYLLVKLRGDRDSLMNTYQTLAQEVGITMDRLRFLDSDPDEYTHRANLHIADVVLDTFPYNGATTTLETIWAGVPMVTKVGESFFARNSYAFLTNVGISAGVAHSDEEYVAWGIELGNNLELRQQISGKMIYSRKNSPLWNTKQFTTEMENAYRKMWTIYQARQGGSTSI